ncbi:MAG: xanthine dehydrogenase family protein molybdopterin-binding subunit [Verrucomicrobia bacterium]|nr:xanthine dehydrogenase family protein molybdopterin-binding subunit [Verrucomicrobiota bacterium]
MSRFDDIFTEPERYEFHEAPMYRFKLARRNFFQLLGGGVLVVCLVKEAIAQESGRSGRRRGGGQRPQDIGAWLHIAEDGMITVFTGKAEVGQNIRTSLTQAVAEELQAPVSSIRLVMADTQLTPFDSGTAGSRTTPDMASQLHRVAAAARELLLDLAAEQQKVDRTALVVADGKITEPKTGAAFSFGQLTKGKKLMKTVGDNPATTPANQWKIAGTSVQKVDGADFVTGKHRYSSDVTLPGLLHGRVLRPAAFGAKLASIDSKEAETISGVTVVHDGDFVGVVAPDTLTADRALRKIRAEWKAEPQISNAELFDHLKKTARNAPATDSTARPEETKDGEHRLKQTYTIAYIAHTPLEPRAAVAEWKDDKLTVWTGTQRPFGVRGELAQAFRIPEEQVRVIVPDTGAGYGGKHTGEAAVEAARLAKAAGKPVKMVWTREEEFTWAYFRPAGVIDVSSAVTNDGKLTAWEFHNYNSGGSAIRALYDVPNQKSEFHGAQSPLRQGSYRSLAAAANHFARESHMDELAHAVKIDPLEFRLKNLKDERLRAVLRTAAEQFGWGKAKPSANRGFGVAAGNDKGSYVATCAEVAVDGKSGRISVVRVAQAFECGAVVNPDHLKNQNEGAIVMGIGGALFEAIHFEKGKILNAHFSEYRLPRFSDAPKIEIVLVNRKDLPSTGAGETPIVGIAPAIGNAIFAATGVRLRSLPMVPDGLKV